MLLQHLSEICLMESHLLYYNNQQNVLAFFSSSPVLEAYNYFRMQSLPYSFSYVHKMNAIQAFMWYRCEHISIMHDKGNTSITN